MSAQLPSHRIRGLSTYSVAVKERLDYVVVFGNLRIWKRLVRVFQIIHRKGERDWVVEGGGQRGKGEYGATASPSALCPPPSTYWPLTNSAIACGVAVSKPTTSSMPASLGSAMLNPFDAIPTTISLAAMPMRSR